MKNHILNKTVKTLLTLYIIFQICSCVSYANYGRSNSTFQFEVELNGNDKYSFWFKDEEVEHLIDHEKNEYTKKLPLKKYHRTYFLGVPISRNKYPEKKEFILIKYDDKLVRKISLVKFRRKLVYKEGQLVLPNKELFNMR